MSTGLFADEEDGYNLEEQNLEETKYVLKGSAPSTDSSVGAIEEPSAEEEPMDDLGGLEDAPAEDKPFDDEPFDAGVDADEDTDPAKYIQQLSGKLGQSLRQHSEDNGQPDFDLEKFAVNSVLSATHTSQMDQEDQRDIINQVKGAGNDEGGEEGGEPEVDVDIEKDVDVDLDGGGEEDFGSEEEVEEIVEELPLNPDDELTTSDLNQVDCSMGMEPVDSEALAALKNVAELKESKKSSTFVDKTKLIKDLRLMENAEPLVEPKPITKPTTKPSKPMREADRPFSPKRRVGVQPDPKAEDNDMITDSK